MSIATDLTRLQSAKNGMKTAIRKKGVFVQDGAKLNEYPALIESIETGESARPADWLPLPDISQETDQKISMLLHIPQNGYAIFGMNLAFAQTESEDPVTVDWGDGTQETIPVNLVDGEGLACLEHLYDYASISGSATSLGEKQAVVTIACTGGNQGKMTDVELKTTFSPTLTTSRYLNTSLLKEIAVQAGINSNVLVSISNYPNLYGFYGYGITGASISACGAMKRFLATGDRFKEVTISSAPCCRKLEIPTGNQYTKISLNQCGVSSLEFSDLSHLTATFAVNNSYGNLTKLIASGLVRSANLNYNGMSKASLVEFLESLGTIPSGSTAQGINLRYGAAGDILTNEEKLIATNKGFQLNIS